MPKESALWRRIRRSLQQQGHFVRVENRVGPGTPDINYCLPGGRGEGWIELKEHPSPPSRGGPLKLKHDLSREQRWWIRERVKTGGRVFVLLLISHPRTYLLMEGNWAAEKLGELTFDGLKEGSLAVFGPDFDVDLVISQIGD